MHEDRMMNFFIANLKRDLFLCIHHFMFVLVIFFSCCFWGSISLCSPAALGDSELAVSQAGLKFMAVLQIKPSEAWDYRSAAPAVLSFSLPTSLSLFVFLSSFISSFFFLNICLVVTFCFQACLHHLTSSLSTRSTSWRLCILSTKHCDYPARCTQLGQKLCMVAHSWKVVSRHFWK